MPEDTIRLIGDIGVCLKSPLMTPKGAGASHTSPNVLLRQALQLYANIRPSRPINGIHCLGTRVNLVMFRENTEGLYCAEQFDRGPETQCAVMLVTKQATQRIVRAACEYAVKHGLKKVVIIGKSNILQQTYGAWMKWGLEVAGDYPGLNVTYMHADAFGEKVVTKPQQFEVVVAENFVGDLLSDVIAGLVGGLGVAPGANIGDSCAVFEAVHGTADDIVGMNRANPTALLISACMMLDHIGQSDVAMRCREALFAAIEAGEKTGDVGGSIGTREFTDAVMARLN